MKKVSFEVAKYLKEVGYPQDIWKYSWFYNENGELLNISNTGYYEIPAPTYLEVWLWLWREKSIQVNIESKIDFTVESKIFGKNDCLMEVAGKDPEDAIINAIKYLTTRKFIK